MRVSIERTAPAAPPLIVGVLSAAAASAVVASQTYPIPYSTKTFARDCVGREAEKLFVLTFDDGPWTTTNSVLDVLSERGAPATFFVIGSTFDSWPAYSDEFEGAVRRTVREGHIIANHGMDNDEFTMSDVDACADEIARVTGGYGMRYFRPARGAYTIDKHDELVEAGYRMIMWNLDVTDWKPHEPDEVLALVRSAVASPTSPVGVDDPANYELPRRGSFIMLAHDTKDVWTRTVTGGGTLLAAAIDSVRDAGYRIVSLDECLGLNGTGFGGGAPPGGAVSSGNGGAGSSGNGGAATTSRCGASWGDALTCAYGACPGGLDGECPPGMRCFGGVRCPSPDGAGGEGGGDWWETPRGDIGGSTASWTRSRSLWVRAAPVAVLAVCVYFGSCL